MVMTLGGKPVYPVLPAHALKIHLGRARTLRYGAPAGVLCGETLTIGIGARRVPAEEWRALHDSLRCQRCERSFQSRGGTDDQ